MENINTKAPEQLIREARQEGIRQGKISSTTAALQKIVKGMAITLEEAMILLEIPRKERKTYIKIFANKERQARERADQNTEKFKFGVDTLKVL